MKYILMMNTMKASAGAFGSWPKEDIQAHIGFMNLKRAVGPSLSRLEPGSGHFHRWFDREGAYDRP